MKRKQAGRRKEPQEMTAAELDAEIERLSGLPLPPRDAPNYIELLAQHHVAWCFLHFAKGRDKSDLEGAKVEAAEFALREPIYGIPAVVPHIERALGRTLAPHEIEARTIFA